MMHFRNVIERSNENRMTKEALATSVGPSIIGFMTEAPDANEIQAASKYQVEKNGRKSTENMRKTTNVANFVMLHFLLNNFSKN